MAGTPAATPLPSTTSKEWTATSSSSSSSTLNWAALERFRSQTSRTCSSSSSDSTVLHPRWTSC